MRSRRLALAILAAGSLAAGCASRSGPEAPTPRPPGVAPRFVRVGVGGASGTRVVRVPLEQYVLATVVAEFAPPRGGLADIEAMIEVQSIINRTFAISHPSRHGTQGFDLCATTHCQLYRPARLKSVRWAEAASEGVRQTAGTVLWFGSGPARVFYHADCGGHTSAASAVWGGASPAYLRARPDDGPAAAAHAAWDFHADRAAIRRALNADRRTHVGARFDAIEILERDEAGRAQLVLLRGEREPVVRGEELRAILVRAFGGRSIRSTRFEVARTGDTFVFTGRGFGHGVGLCRAGAFARIRAGASPEEVLEIYFPETKLIQLAGR